MTGPALQAIEEAYSFSLNPDEDYLSQLQALAASGELANKLTSNNVLFKLCMIVDTQAKVIEQLQETVSKLVVSEKEEIHATTPDPTQPLTNEPVQS